MSIPSFDHTYLILSQVQSPEGRHRNLTQFLNFVSRQIQNLQFLQDIWLVEGLKRVNLVFTQVDRYEFRQSSHQPGIHYLVSTQIQIPHMLIVQKTLIKTLEFLFSKVQLIIAHAGAICSPSQPR